MRIAIVRQCRRDRTMKEGMKGRLHREMLRWKQQRGRLWSRRHRHVMEMLSLPRSLALPRHLLAVTKRFQACWNSLEAGIGVPIRTTRAADVTTVGMLHPIQVTGTIHSQMTASRRKKYEAMSPCPKYKRQRNDRKCKRCCRVDVELPYHRRTSHHRRRQRKLVN